MLQIVNELTHDSEVSLFYGLLRRGACRPSIASRKARRVSAAARSLFWGSTDRWQRGPQRPTPDRRRLDGTLSRPGRWPGDRDRPTERDPRDPPFSCDARRMLMSWPWSPAPSHPLIAVAGFSELWALLLVAYPSRICSGIGHEKP